MDILLDGLPAPFEMLLAIATFPFFVFSFLISLIASPTMSSNLFWEDSGGGDWIGFSGPTLFVYIFSIALSLPIIFLFNFIIIRITNILLYKIFRKPK